MLFAKHDSFMVCNLEVTDGEIFPVVGVENSIHILSADEPLLTQATRSQKGETLKITRRSK